MNLEKTPSAFESHLLTGRLSRVQQSLSKLTLYVVLLLAGDYVIPYCLDAVDRVQVDQ